MQRRTSNFLELPVADYDRNRRYQSLPTEPGYNPRLSSNELYRLRAFSISPKGALIKHGDQMASRRSRSPAGSTANTSRQASRSASRGASPYASHSGSREVSPLARSPVGAVPQGGLGGRAHPPLPHQATSSSWSNQSEEVSPVFPPDDVVASSADADGVGHEPVKYRVCVLGQNGSGKTALVTQFLTSEYINTYDASLDEDCGERSVSVVLDGEESELVFIDHTSGEMSVENTLSTYDPHCIVVAYSVVERASFQAAEEILGYLWSVGYLVSGRNAVILVANKVDLERSRVISQYEGKKLAKSYESKFIETSAGIQHNVDELLVGILKQIRLHQAAVAEAAAAAANVSDVGGDNAASEASPEPSSSKKGGGGKKRRRSKKRKESSQDKDKGGLRSPLPGSLSSPLHTLQVARDILARVCFSPSASCSKSCENLHVL